MPHSLPTDSPSTFSFSIITAHHGSGTVDDPLFCSVASLIDQEGIKSEHILQHTGEATGLWNKLSRALPLSKRAPHYTLRLLEEKNSPLHEALYHGVARATGTVIGFLQPGEQYLPGALRAVEKEFQTHPDIDLLITGAFTLEEGSKKTIPHAPLPLSLEYLWTCSPKIYPSTLFFRSELIKTLPLHTTSFAELLVQLLQAGTKSASLPYHTILTESTASSTTPAFHQTAPAMMRFLRPWWQWRHCRDSHQNPSFLPSLPSCLVYQPGSLTHRIQLS